jgi:hypothetical protein
MTEPFDLEAVYDAEIAPLMRQIIAICKRERMPVFASFAYGSDGEGHDFCTTHLPFDGRTPPQFTKAHGLIYQGFAALTVRTRAVVGPEVKP